MTNDSKPAFDNDFLLGYFESHQEDGKEEPSLALSIPKNAGIVLM